MVELKVFSEPHQPDKWRAMWWQEDMERRRLRVILPRLLADMSSAVRLSEIVTATVTEHLAKLVKSLDGQT